MKPPGPYLSVVPEPGDDDPELERYLGAARELAEPDASSRARVARALNAALPPTAPLPTFGANAASSASSSAALASVARLLAPWLAVGALVIGGSSFWLGWTMGHTEAAVSPGAAQAHLQSAPQATLPSAPPLAATNRSSVGVAVTSPPPLVDDVADPRAPAANAGSDVAPGAATAASAATTPAKPARTSRRSSPIRAATGKAAPGAALGGTPESSPIDFRQALERLRRARTQLEQGHATASLLLLSELDRDAGELLHEEREATRVLALCATGETLAARASAERLAQRSPRSIYLRRLASSCVEDAERDVPSTESAF